MPGGGGKKLPNDPAGCHHLNKTFGGKIVVVSGIKTDALSQS